MPDDKEVRFDLYCKSCEHHGLGEWEDPCNECLDHPFNYGSEKPVNYKGKGGEDNGRRKSKKEPTRKRKGNRGV